MVLATAALLSGMAASQAPAPPAVTPAFFESHRDRLFARLPAGSIAVFHAAQARGGASSDPYRQDSDFWYLTGLDEPNAVAVFVPGAAKESRYVLFVQPKDFAAEQWTGWRAGVEGAKKDHGAGEAHPGGVQPRSVQLVLHEDLGGVVADLRPHRGQRMPRGAVGCSDEQCVGGVAVHAVGRVDDDQPLLRLHRVA